VYPLGVRAVDASKTSPLSLQRVLRTPSLLEQPGSPVWLEAVAPHLFLVVAQAFVAQADLLELLRPFGVPFVADLREPSHPWMAALASAVGSLSSTAASLPLLARGSLGCHPSVASPSGAMDASWPQSCDLARQELSGLLLFLEGPASDEL